MPSIPWSTNINFASALLLHSCITILLKGLLNILETSKRLLLRRRKPPQKPHAPAPKSASATSIVLDAYTSILSADTEGESAELYFTNTGFALLALSLSSSVAMNLLLPDLALNIIVAGTFGVVFTVSLAVGRAKYTLPLMALRRAGRFIWSDTPFINFFSLIYIATVLKSQSNLRLQDYITFRCIAVFELVFMKARLASAEPETQVTLMRKLFATERIMVHTANKTHLPSHDQPPLSRKEIQAFSTSQRLFLMFIKTTIGHDSGCVTGAMGPAQLSEPAIGFSIQDNARGWKLCRSSEDVMTLSDCLAESNPKDKWSRFMAYMHGILLRRLGKKRVVYPIRRASDVGAQEPYWHSNVNLITGVSMEWLDKAFSPGQVEQYCVVAGRT